MAKKVVATLKKGDGKDFARVIKMVKNEKGSYSLKEEVMHKDGATEFFKSK